MKIPSVVIEALWDAGIVGDNGSLMDDDSGDDLHEQALRVIDENGELLSVDNTLEASRFFTELGNHHDGAAENKHSTADERAYYRRLRDACSRFAQRLGR